MLPLPHGLFPKAKENILCFAAGATVIVIQSGTSAASSTCITKTCPSFAVSCAGPQHPATLTGREFPFTPKHAGKVISLSADIELDPFLTLFI